jgi:methylenetetrahydrofolate reductase (NADPH)
MLEPLLDVSFEITSKDVSRLTAAAPFLTPGAQISITFLGGEDMQGRVAAAGAVRDLGFVPRPHISARRLRSVQELEDFLGDLQVAAAIDRVFVVAGDLPEPAGPFGDSLALIETGLLQRYGVSLVGVAGYPEGHPGISDSVLWQALERKHQHLERQGLECEITTQFGFDAAPVLEWAAGVRARGISSTIRVGLPGPASLKTLLAFSARCGVGASASVLKRYGLSLTRLLDTAGPDKLVDIYLRELEARHGDIRLHLYPFGGLQRAAEWLKAYSYRV